MHLTAQLLAPAECTLAPALLPSAPAAPRSCRSPVAAINATTSVSDSYRHLTARPQCSAAPPLPAKPKLFHASLQCIHPGPRYACGHDSSPASLLCEESGLLSDSGDFAIPHPRTRPHLEQHEHHIPVAGAADSPSPTAWATPHCDVAKPPAPPVSSLSRSLFCPAHHDRFERSTAFAARQTRLTASPAPRTAPSLQAPLAAAVQPSTPRASSTSSPPFTCRKQDQNLHKPPERPRRQSLIPTLRTWASPHPDAVDRQRNEALAYLCYRSNFSPHSTQKNTNTTTSKAALMAEGKAFAIFLRRPVATNVCVDEANGWVCYRGCACLTSMTVFRH
ncbi:hypothetical protein B0H13DRAFT_2662411 [Mycena leptocephala]|nr:hypothetical protein B0H13DRAFT_2662411 [Mycena leptocephala]